MSKKTIAYILIGVIAIGGIIYMLSQKSSSLSSITGSLGQSGFEKDDTEAYNKMKALVPGGIPGWVTDAVKERYDTNPTMIGGYKSKAATFNDVLGAAAPSDEGTYPATSWSNGKKLRWPDATVFVPMWKIRTDLIAKYNSL